MWGLPPWRRYSAVRPGGLNRGGVLWPSAVTILLALTASALSAPPVLAAGGLPPVTASYSGEFRETVERTTASPQSTVASLNWTAMGSSGGMDGTLPLTYTTMAGSIVTEYSDGCKEYERRFSLSPQNPFPGGWGLNENSEYPMAGWKYIVSAPLHFQPVHEHEVQTACVGNKTSFTSERDTEFEVKGLVNDARAEEQLAQFEPIEARPGGPTTVVHEFNSNETVTGHGLPEPAKVQVHLKLTISVTIPPAGNMVESPNPKSKAPPSTPPATKRTSEKRRRELKQQARADLGPALQDDLAAHGLSAGIGLASGLLLSEVANELGQKAALFDGNDANLRVINDYRIINDPPAPNYRALARPGPITTPVLPSCARFHEAAAATYCATLRAAETALLVQSAQAAAIDKALYTTISRDSAAIKAHSYAVAEQQATHFKALHASFAAVLGARAHAGVQVAALLRQAGATGTATSAQSAKAIKAVERQLSRAGIATAAIKRLAGSALTPRKTNFLDVLGQR